MAAAARSASRFPRQRGGPSRQARPSKPKPTPANDNRPRPANDNRPRSARRNVPRGASRAFRMAGRLAGPLAAVMAADYLLKNYEKVWEELFGAQDYYRLRDQWSNFSLEYQCNQSSGCVTDYRAENYRGRATYSVAGKTCPDGCENHGTAWPTFPEAAANYPGVGQWVTRMPSTSFGSNTVKRAWHRTATGTPRPMIYPEPYRLPDQRPYYFPELDPIGIPIGVPMPVPSPVPWAVPRPDQNPEEGTRRGPRPQRFPRPDLRPRVVPSVNPAVRLAVSSQAARRRPPRPGEKEKKWSSPYAGSWMAAAFNAVTETHDFVEAFYDALPKSRQTCTGGKALLCRANAVWNHLDEVDPNQAMTNLLLNAAEDAAVGRFMNALQKAAAGAGVNPGSVNPTGKAPYLP